ncbi:hypothetical protein IW140_003458 [Coemansia sp. RSA 1813]|nr:hypothetical protein EV178_000858 [Coemansia sp. RSA 1646]KAJ1769587.1 hypothetical protein LPJ74_003898 [Coemansia sp. RSA 1843]KAJ2088436.1 hypothetical protein IW138_004214 [Coemansia sp. RSA 986]KAJ2213530.1 hypothetical protein EV179_003755 [Coemansia sp. RSA 487]KAJ2568952.1 hypothetical protein IW140_003458 [Coemansia sp. RSA 1813]
MGRIDLQLKAELTNVTDLMPASSDHCWNFKIKCNSCHEVDKNLITISAQDGSQISGSRGEANLVMKCKFCKREGVASIVGEPAPYTAENSGSFARVLTVECRGIEPVEVELRDGWRAKSTESNECFELDLTESEWYDYDDKAAVEVSVTEIESQLVRSK